MKNFKFHVYLTIWLFFIRFGFFSDMVCFFSQEMSGNPVRNTDALATHYDLAGVEIFLYLGPRALEILQAPRYLNPALHRCYC